MLLMWGPLTSVEISHPNAIDRVSLIISLCLIEHLMVFSLHKKRENKTPRITKHFFLKTFVVQLERKIN